MNSRHVLVKCSILASLALSFTVNDCYAQSKQPFDTDYGAWTPVTCKFPIYHKVQGYCEYQPRWQKEQIRSFTESIIRSGLGYEFNPRWSVFAGYYWSIRFDQKTNHENRLWQQVTYTRKHGQFQIQNRVRLEETWHKQYEGSSVRARNQIRITYNLGRSRWYLIGGEEPIINLNSPEKGPEAGFAQNRLFVGVGRKLNRFTRLEVGYLNQYRFSRTARPDQVNHVLVSQLAFDYTQKSKPESSSESKLAVTPSPQGTVLACAPRLVFNGLDEHPTMLFSQPAEAGFSNLHTAVRHIAAHRTRAI